MVEMRQIPAAGAGIRQNSRPTCLEGSELEALFELENSSLEEEEMDFEVVDKGKGQDSDMEEENNEQEENGDRDGHGDWEHSTLANPCDLLGNDSTSEHSSAHPTPTPSNMLFSDAQELTEAQPNFNLRSDSKKPAPHLVPWTRHANAFGTFIQLETYQCKDLKNGKMALKMLDNAECAWATLLES
ncbi:hypothetical protein FRC06_010988 [Ceratobasidium sp. 370]|nr:hypothetical protein FRC06_010988 [Ceratobasidium sp. 370]